MLEDRGWARGQKCRVRGVGGIEPDTARRLMCTGTVLGAVVDAHGDVLALGRTRRLVSKVRRRALMLRDETCRLPGCTRRSHLQAHHRISWADGGVTDLENLLLLRGDTYIHPDAVRIRPQQYGERFSLHDSVQALFAMMLPQDQQAA